MKATIFILLGAGAGLITSILVQKFRTIEINFPDTGGNTITNIDDVNPDDVGNGGGGVQNLGKI